MPAEPTWHVEEYLAEGQDAGTAYRYCGMLTMLPPISTVPQKTELIFLLDRSGSMEGGSMRLLIDAMRILLKSLPRDCYINIVGFGSSFKALFSASKPHN